MSPETARLATEVGLQLLDVLLERRGSAKLADLNDAEAQQQLRAIQAGISTSAGTEDFLAVLEEHRRRVAEGGEVDGED